MSDDGEYQEQVGPLLSVIQNWKWNELWIKVDEESSEIEVLRAKAEERKRRQEEEARRQEEEKQRIEQEKRHREVRSQYSQTWNPYA